VVVQAFGTNGDEGSPVTDPTPRRDGGPSARAQPRAAAREAAETPGLLAACRVVLPPFECAEATGRAHERANVVVRVDIRTS
jgi:hypothetical protein